MKLYTIQLAKHRLLKDTDITLLDVTVKSGLKIMAPSWEILNNYRNQGSTDRAWEEYTLAFYQKMRESYAMNPQIWHRWITNDKPLALACYCRAGKHCHRHLLRDIFQKIAKKQGFELEYCGEIETLENIRNETIPIN